MPLRQTASKAEPPHLREGRGSPLPHAIIYGLSSLGLTELQTVFSWCCVPFSCFLLEKMWLRNHKRSVPTRTQTEVVVHYQALYGTTSYEPATSRRHPGRRPHNTAQGCYVSYMVHVRPLGRTAWSISNPYSPRKGGREKNGNCWIPPQPHGKVDRSYRISYKTRFHFALLHRHTAQEKRPTRDALQVFHFRFHQPSSVSMICSTTSTSAVSKSEIRVLTPQSPVP